MRILKTDNSTIEVPDSEMSLAFLQDAVGGYIEAIYLDAENVMYVNEDGKQRNLPINGLATAICEQLNKISATDYIAGDAVIAPIEEEDDEDA